ncbi:MAG: glycosyltransferase [Anaerolineaceae bacterium]|nr:glycosyltransferase [Anaerolineaceae bacterium]
MAEIAINDTKLVSVIIRTYNHEDYIYDTLQSVLNQNYTKIQVIVVNDNSTDRTEEIIFSIIEEHPGKITYFKNRKNIGELQTYNKGLSLVKGKYVALLDGDDVYFPNKIRKQVEFLDNHQNVTACYHDVAVFTQNPMDPSFYWSDRFDLKSGSSKTIARYGHFPCAVSVMLRREFMPDEGHSIFVKTQGDWLYLVDVLENSGGEIQNINQVLAGYRIHQKNISGNWQEKLESRFISAELGSKKYPALKQEFTFYCSEMLFLKFLYCIGAKKFSLALKPLILSLRKSFPNFLILFRIPFRELKFLFKSKPKKDQFLSNFFN